MIGDLDELSEVYPVAQDQLDGADIGLESVSGQLVAIFGSGIGQLPNKGVRGLRRALA